jgi:hypothetical protein
LASEQEAKEAASQGDLRREECSKLVENVGKDEQVEACVLQALS